MDGFEIKTIPGKGRILIASKNFNKDDTIFEEEPFCSIQFSWNSSAGYAACDHCLRPLETITENVHRLTKTQTTVPLLEHDPTAQWLPQFTSCPSCKVRYCSEDCRMEALKRYHRAGCMGHFRLDVTHPINVLNEVWKKIHYPPETTSILLIVRLMAMYQQRQNKQEFLQELQEFQSFSVNEEQQIFHKLLGENFEQDLLKLYTAFCNAFQDEVFAVFKTPEAFKSLWALLGTNAQGIGTSTLAEWVRKVSDLPLSVEDKTKLDLYIDEIYSKVDEVTGIDFLNNEGSGLYRLQSKINHSCVPNALSTFPYSNDIFVLKALAPIQAGEEICISYLEDCVLERSRHTRQKILKANYIFTCECQKCQLQSIDADETSEDDDDDDHMEMDE